MKRITELQKEYGDAVRAVAPEAILVTHSVRDGNKITRWQTHVCIPAPCRIKRTLKRKLGYLVDKYFAPVNRAKIIRWKVPHPRRHHPMHAHEDVNRMYRKIIFNHPTQ